MTFPGVLGRLSGLRVQMTRPRCPAVGGDRGGVLAGSGADHPIVDGAGAGECGDVGASTCGEVEGGVMDFVVGGGLVASGCGAAVAAVHGEQCEDSGSPGMFIPGAAQEDRRVSSMARVTGSGASPSFDIF